MDITQQLSAQIDDDPVRTCAVACRYALYDIANQAAKATCRDVATKITTLKPDYLSLMGIDHYQSLIHYRLQVSETAAQAIQKFPTSEDVEFVDESWQIYGTGTRDSATSCACPLSRWEPEGVESDDHPLYVTPWLEMLKTAARSAVQDRPAWDTVSADGRLAMEAVKVAMDAKCSVCMHEALGCPWTVKKIGRRVNAGVDKVSQTGLYS